MSVASSSSLVQLGKRAMGCLLGQAVGDALGTRYEFSSSDKVCNMVDNDCDKDGFLHILGEGPFRVVPGQVTDDTELALGLARALVKSRGFVPEEVAHAYTMWMKSPPFDCGATIRSALSKTRLNNTKEENYRIICDSATSNGDSQSNGCLMRISPLAIAGVRSSEDRLLEAASIDCLMTNPNPITIDAVKVYVAAIRTAILTGDRHKTYATAVRVAQTPAVRAILERAKKGAEFIILDDGKQVTADSQYMGYFGIALQATFYELLHGTSFDHSVVDIICRGGDTDTNACIAGALLGALYGDQGIPTPWIDTVLHAKTQKRQAEYPLVKTSDLRELAIELLGEEGFSYLPEMKAK